MYFKSIWVKYFSHLKSSLELTLCVEQDNDVQKHSSTNTVHYALYITGGLQEEVGVYAWGVLLNSHNLNYSALEGY